MYIQALLRDLLLHTLEVHQSHIDSDLALRTFKKLEPRISQCMEPKEDWEGSQDAVSSVNVCLKLSSLTFLNLTLFL